ncbi:MAG: tRNA epoxyqueuosine(34) reductase QueG [Candidatus Omnitrophica bacterium]|nr:tRNA epoxyqueuosine(34) reductase QueG [Candidatus Omnitrophota bacterium]
MPRGDPTTPGQESRQDLTRTIKEEALRLGFQKVGVVPSSAIQARRENLAGWIRSGFAGRLKYMEQFFERQSRLLAGLPDLRSIVVLAVPYGGGPLEERVPPETPGGRVARYAKGRDYHRVIRKRMKELESFVRAQAGEPTRTLCSIDTAPVQERVLAEMAGLGFIGKNSCLILPRGGSFVFLAAILTNLDLEPDRPVPWDCGACTLCLEACPTQALVRPYELDARRCISYLTIEMKEAIDPALRPLMGDWIFGCDICQQVCPYNRKTTEDHSWEEFQPETGAGARLPLEEILTCRSEEAFTGRFAGTPLMRSKRVGLLRNAAVVAGNLEDPRHIPALAAALLEEPTPIVRQHAAWALGRISTQEAIEALQTALHRETDPAVRQEIESALRAALKT